MSLKLDLINGKANGLTLQASAWTGLCPNASFAIVNADAPVVGCATTVTEPRLMIMIIGAGTCHIILGD